MSLRGKALGEAVIAHLETHPEQHNQKHVVWPKSKDLCVGCITGHTVAIGKGVPLVDLTKVTLRVGPRSDTAIEMLGVDPIKWYKDVFTEVDEKKALANFKVLVETLD